MHRPTTLTAVGKARRRSSLLLRPALPKSPRTTVRRVTPGIKNTETFIAQSARSQYTPGNTSRLAAPLPSKLATGRSTTIGISGCPSLGRSAARPIVTTSRFPRPAVGRSPEKTSSRPLYQRHSTIPTSKPSAAPFSRPASRSSAIAPRQPSEVAQLKEKLSTTEQLLMAQKAESETRKELYEMLQKNVEMMKLQLEKCTTERDLQTQMVNTLKHECENMNETLVHKDTLIKSLTTQLEENESALRSLHNDVVDLKGQIRVAIRVRPMLQSEAATSSSSALKFPTVNAISIVLGSKPAGPFEFEKVFTPVFSQKEVFANIQDFILSGLHGYNVGLIAFGQTGSGKTHTMRGKNDEEEGIIPRAASFLFKESEKLEATGWTFEFSLSFLEIYNNEAYDLLDNHKVVKLRLSNQDVVMDGLSQHPLKKLSNMEELLRRADANRKTAATKCNAHSSRSHAIYMWNIKAHQESTGISTSSVLKLVDLAGSERAKESGAVGQQFTEMTAINTSLSVLQKCIGMQRARASHVPYRESKLTQVLMDCLGRGNSKTMVIVNINPCNEQAQETKRSIEFASKMRETNIGTAVQQRDL